MLMTEAIRVAHQQEQDHGPFDFHRLTVSPLRQRMTEDMRMRKFEVLSPMEAMPSS